MSAAEDRQREILALVERRGYASIELLTGLFKVTPQTIRRDINALADRKLIMRQHGGASLPSSVLNTSYSVRHVEQAAEKERIARTLVDYLPDRASLFMALGTTIEAVAHALPVRRKLKIVTNNPEVARILWPRTDFEIVLTGGTVQHWNGGLVGERALGVVSSFRCDYLVSGIGAVEADGTLLDYHDAEVAVMQAMMRNARHTWLVADHTKFRKTANQRVGHLSDLTALFTDAPPPAAIRSIAEEHEVELVLPGADRGVLDRTGEDAASDRAEA